jgi:adenylate cyclase
VLFADIAGFTALCTNTPPEAVVEDLNLYFEHMDAAVAEHGGIVDKRMGDGMMVVFVAVDRQEPLAGLGAAAIRCGLAMLRRLPRCNAELAARGRAPFAIRVGVAAGALVHGNIGSPERMEYTVIGEPVNLAARLQSAAATNHLLTLPDCLTGLPRLAAAATRRVIALRGLGEVAACELAPAVADA